MTTRLSLLLLALTFALLPLAAPAAAAGTDCDEDAAAPCEEPAPDDHRAAPPHDDEDDDHDGATALADGAFALQFGIGPDFDLQTFEGSVLSAKYHLSARSAFRLGLSGSVSVTDDEQVTIPDDDDFSSTRTISEDSLNLQLDLPYLRYFQGLDERIVPFLGIGPSVGFIQADRTAETFDVDGVSDRTRTTEREASRFSVGLLGVVGGEWFVRDNLSLTAEYRLRLAYADESVDVRDTIAEDGVTMGEQRVEQDSTNFSVRSGGVLLGVSLYF
jgi:opacity protein-like surface antigen